MNIAIFTNNYLPNPYGVTQSIESFRRKFEKMGHQVYIFAPNYKNYKDENPNVFRYPALDIEIKIKFPLAIPYSRKMDKILGSLNIDLIHSQHPNLLGTAALKWAHRKKIPLVFTWHTMYDKYIHFAPIVPKKIALNYIIRKAVNYANTVNFIVVPTKSVIKIIENWGVKNKNITVIPTGVDIVNFENPDREKIREKFNIGENERLLLINSRLTEEKNLSFLFRAIFEVLKRNDKTKFMVVSGGDLMDELKKMAERENLSERIIFTGVIARNEIKNYYAAGDIFVYASKSETQGMIITEAMYMGLPIVAVNATGICDLVENNKTGLLVEENEVEFAKAVEKLIQDKSLRDKMGEEGAKAARKKYTDEVCAEKMVDVYRKTIEDKKNNR